LTRPRGPDKRAPQPRGPPPHRRRWHLPRPNLRDPAHRRRPGRAARRMERRPPLPGPRGPRPVPDGADPDQQEGGPFTRSTHCL